MSDKYYASPRISGEFLDCSMPMTFDQYSNCGYNCLYCFSTFQRGIGSGAEDYWLKKVKAVNVEKFKKFGRFFDKYYKKTHHFPTLRDIESVVL